MKTEKLLLVHIHTHEDTNPTDCYTISHECTEINWFHYAWNQMKWTEYKEIYL